MQIPPLVHASVSLSVTWGHRPYLIGHEDSELASAESLDGCLPHGASGMPAEKLWTWQIPRALMPQEQLRQRHWAGPAVQAAPADPDPTALTHQALIFYVYTGHLNTVPKCAGAHGDAGGVCSSLCRVGMDLDPQPPEETQTPGAGAGGLKEGARRVPSPEEGVPPLRAVITLLLRPHGQVKAGAIVGPRKVEHPGAEDLPQGQQPVLLLGLLLERVKIRGGDFEDFCIWNSAHRRAACHQHQEAQGSATWKGSQAGELKGWLGAHPRTVAAAPSPAAPTPGWGVPACTDPLGEPSRPQPSTTSDLQPPTPAHSLLATALTWTWSVPHSSLRSGLPNPV